MNRDNHDKQVLKALQSIAATLRVIAKNTDKDVAEKPYMESDGDYNGVPVWDYYCPECNHLFENGDKTNYCPDCGQKIDWSENNT